MAVLIRNRFMNICKCNNFNLFTLHFNKKNKLLDYSTIIERYVDVLDVFVDALKKKPEVQLTKLHKAEGPVDVDVIKKLTDDLNRAAGDVNITQVCDRFIHAYLKRNSYDDVCKILEYCKCNALLISRDTLTVLAEKFTDSGYKDGLLSVQSVCETTDPEEFLQQGHYLYYFSKIAWLNGNIKECISNLKELNEVNSNLLNNIKSFLYIVIEKTVSSKSEAELIILTKFIKQFCNVHNDHHLVAVLWSSLFQSEWFTDQQQANELLDTTEELKIYIKFMSLSLSRHLLQRNKISDVHRLLQLLLKLEMFDQYKMITQIMFDIYCLQGQIQRCSELVKSSVTLQLPLRKDQYNRFISLNVHGTPHKTVNLTNVIKYL